MRYLISLFILTFAVSLSAQKDDIVAAFNISDAVHIHKGEHINIDPKPESIVFHWYSVRFNYRVENSPKRVEKVIEGCWVRNPQYKGTKRWKCKQVKYKVKNGNIIEKIRGTKGKFLYKIKPARTITPYKLNYYN